MSSRIGKLLATVLGLVLLVYSASRSLDFISLTLPPERQILAWFGLAALDGGLVAWLLAYLYGSDGAWQRAIALIMIVIDFIGAVAMFTLDTLYNTGRAGLTAVMTPEVLQTAVLALSLIIALNIGATIAHHMLDPESLRRHAEETARAEIEDAALQLIRENSRQLAAEVAPQVANSWRDGIVTEYGHRLKKPRQKKLPEKTEMPEEANPTSRRSQKKG